MTAAHEVCRAGTGVVSEDLAEEALYWACKVIDGNWRSGTRFTSASTALSAIGQPLEATWPYDESRPDWVAYAPPSPPDATWFTADLAPLTADTATVKAELDNGRPVVLGVVVYDTMFVPTLAGRVEVAPATAPARGRHALLAVGYDANDDALLIRNSWGNTWALGGYGWLADEYVARHLREAWRVGVAPGTASTSATTTSGDVYGTQ